jgi:RNA polymerase sigma factor (sigma-70 family)
MSAIAAVPTRPPRILPLSRLGDESLAARAADGNSAAFSELCERYHAPLLGYCRSILLNDDDAHDATQAALENALRALPRKDPGRPLRPWLYRIAHNESINVVRRRSSHAELTELDEPSVPGPEVDSEHRVRLAQLVDDLRGLPERQRGALVMRELSGLSYDEIAEALGVSNEAARRAVFDAREALHEAVDGRATDCVNVRHCISDGDRRRLRTRRIRAHLRSCDDCKNYQQAIGARSADLHLLGGWLSGGVIASMLGGGAGGGALLAAGSGAATVSVAGWSSMPVMLKGLTVAAVVATTGGAAAEIKHVAKPAAPAALSHAARPAPSHSATALPSTARPLRVASEPATARRTHASANSSHGRVRRKSLSGTAVAPRRPAVAPAQPVVTTAPPAPTATHTQTSTTTSKPQAQSVKSKLADLREQVLAAVQEAQAIAAAGTPGAIDLATKTLDSSLAALRPMIERLLGSVGLSLPEYVSTPPADSTTPPSTTTAPSLPTTVLQPVQQVIDGVDSLLGKLFTRTAG